MRLSDSNDEECKVFEVVALRDPLENAVRLVEVLHVKSTIHGTKLQ